MEIGGKTFEQSDLLILKGLAPAIAPDQQRVYC